MMRVRPFASPASHELRFTRMVFQAALMFPLLSVLSCLPVNVTQGRRIMLQSAGHVHRGPKRIRQPHSQMRCTLARVVALRTQYEIV
jgi:hypothetical protein